MRSIESARQLVDESKGHGQEEERDHERVNPDPCALPRGGIRRRGIGVHRPRMVPTTPKPAKFTAWVKSGPAAQARHGPARFGPIGAPPSVGELGWELGDDPVAQHVGHVQDLGVDLVVRGDVIGVSALRGGRRPRPGSDPGGPSSSPSSRPPATPAGWRRPGTRRSHRIGVPGGAGGGHVATSLGRIQQGGRAQDVLAQQA